MPFFTASTISDTIGLYVDGFIDPSGRLSNLSVLSGGSGYTTVSPPTIQVSGGGGSGAEIEPVIINGEIASVRFVKNPNLGELRGNNYTSIPSFSLVGGSGSGASITCELSQDTTILGVPANENSLLQFCADQRINYLALYGLRNIDWQSDTSANLSKPGKNILADFISKARSSGITDIGAVTTGSISNVDNIISYQNERTGSTERFDWINLEREYWNGDGNINQYLNRLSYIRQQATGGTPHVLGVEAYFGWPSYSDMVSIIPFLDRVLLDDFSSAGVPDYDYTKSRLHEIIGSACTYHSVTIDLMPVFSAEKVSNPWNARYEFLGSYYSANTIYSSWYNWAIIPSGNTFGNINLGSFNSESESGIREWINPVGQMIFGQKLLRVSSPPTLPPFTPYISVNGPITFNSGQSVLLSANPEGALYEWQPYGETGNTITASTSGSYSVSVTNFSGVTGSSTAITVTVLSSTCQADIYYTGSTNFVSGGTLTLEANSGSTYYWIPNGETTQSIVVSGSGDYQVIVSDFSGCTGTSQVVSVTVSACETTITPSGTVSAETGSGVFIQADPSALSYYWYPNGETISSIIAIYDDDYYVTVDYGNGCVTTSQPTSVYFFPCVALISHTGSTTLISGETLVLSANSADLYYWYPNGETTQTITVSEPGTYSVRNWYYSTNCTAYSESVTVNVVSGTCTASIQASGPLYYASGQSVNSVILSANSGFSYLWSPGGETGQTITVSGSGIFSVQVDNGYGCVADSSIVVTANNYDPIGGIWTEDTYPTVLNSSLYSSVQRSLIPWSQYQINLSDSNIEKYFLFFKIRSTNGRKAGLRFAVNDVNNFIPITAKRNTTFGWYRLQLSQTPFTQLFENEINTFFIQPINNNTQIQQFVVSSDSNFVPGPYPNYSFV